MNEINSIIEQIRAANEQPYDEPTYDGFDEIKKQVVIDRNVEYPDPEYLIEIGGVPTIPKGNLVALSAKWKNGKTFFCDILSAIFLGSDQFANCRSLMDGGRVLFFDTEQAESDTARIRKTIDAMIPESRLGDFEVSCLRDVPIDKDMEEGATMSRMDFIKRFIELDHPDLVVIDGIADLIFNYNDVVESQSIVNQLAAVANRHNCAIIVVMHQNKGQKDRNMKGHLGTMLFQKCSDVFNVEKCGSVFIASHAVSRHRDCEDICFKLDANAVPMDAVADRQLQVELDRQRDRAKLQEQISLCFEDTTVALKRSAIVKMIQENLGYANRKSYELFNQAVNWGILKTNDKRHYFLVPLQAGGATDDLPPAPE